jgi:formate hydrogenlyase subunit 3/multisubunit Na+/H+ antiporter MnhD subunit
VLDSLGRWLIVIGLGIAALGVLLFLLGKLPFAQWFGKLPGDIRYRSPDGSLSCLVPIVSSILLSILLTIILNLVLRLINRR